MRPPTCSRTRRRHRGVRLFALLMLGAAILTGVAVAVAGSSPAWADPTPAATPAAEMPDPGTRPSPNPGPGTPETTPAPTLGPTPPGWTPPSDSEDDPGLFDIPGQIRKAINDMLLWIATTGLKPVLDTLGQTVLSTPDLTGNAQVTAFWTASLVAANGIFVLFVMAGGFIVAARETLQTSYGLKEIAPRVVVAGVAANVSLLVAGRAIEAVNALTAAIAGHGVDGQAAVTAIEQMLAQPATGTGVPPVLFSLLVLAVLVMAIVVVMTFVLRIALLVLLIGLAPLALTCHATPQTEGLAYAWWRAFAACLGIQLGQAVIILATVRIFLTPAGPQVLGMPATTGGLLAILVCLTMLWLLIKLPSWMKHLVLGPLGQRHGRGLVGQIIHAVIMLKTLGVLAGVGGGTSRSRAARRPRPDPGTGSSRRRGPSPSRPAPGTSAPRPRSRSGAVGSRPRPAPVAFSSAPATHTPRSAPVGSAAAPVFSHAPTPAGPRPAPASPAAAARFSHQPGAPAATPAAGTRPAPVKFSHAPAPATPTPARRGGPAPAAAFSAAPRPQAAPKRPPAPAAPVFSSPTRPAPATGRATPARHAAGSSPPAVPSRSPAPPSPRSSPPRGGGRAPSPPVPPSPSGRAARPTPPPSQSPAPRSSPAGASSPSRRSRQGRPRHGGER